MGPFSLCGRIVRSKWGGGVLSLTRIEERLGYRTERMMDHGADVWSLDTWPLVPEGETSDTWDEDEAEDVETCNTVDAGCLAPAGYLGAGGSVTRGTVAADGQCTSCEEGLCSNCADSEGRCIMCSEEDEDGDDD